MGNVIKRRSCFIEAKPLTEYGKNTYGDSVVFFNTADGWVGKDKNGKSWKNLVKHLRMKELYEFTEQYSFIGFVNYLMERNTDYQTVAYEFISKAIETAFKEMSTINSFDDIYQYILANLL